jgi:hypothetical protein
VQIDADPDPVPAYHFDKDPDANPDPDFIWCGSGFLLDADADPGYQNDADQDADPDPQTGRNCLGSILASSDTVEFWGAADEAVLNEVLKKLYKKCPC